MNLFEVHPHAYIHGLSEDDIRSAWENAFEWIRRDLDNGGIDYLLVGPDRRGRLVEMVARYCSEVEGYIVFHAMTPPTKKVLREIGVER